MIKKILLIAATIALIIAVVYKTLEFKRSVSIDLMQATPLQEIVATYNTGSNSIVKSNDSILYQTINWVNNSVKSLPEEQIKSLINKKLPLFINLQIWPKGVIAAFDNNIAGVIISGYYDEKLISFFNLLGKSANTVYIRYNAEMELPSNQYPWQAKSFNEYILSYRHLYVLCKKYAPAAKMVWGPNGYSGAEEYWPGEEFADLVSVNLSMQLPFKKCPYPIESTIEEMMQHKFFRMRFMNKPVLFLSSASVNRHNIASALLDSLNKKIAADLPIYRTPIVPTEHDSAATKQPGMPYLQLGVYDPLLLLTGQPIITTEHIFTDMISVLNGFFKMNFDSVISRQHNVIVTIEPWKDGKREKDPAILTNTLNGTYDMVWSKLYEIISDAPQTVYLRWGHEMEIPIDRYAWQSKDPVAYIKAFRYFATFKKPKANNIKIVWGPAGDRGCMDYYPGNDVVDFVSFAIYGLPNKNINDHTRQQKFSTIFQYKLHRMRFAHHPIFITEFGVKGPESFQKQWLEEATSIINKHPEIYGLSYFNYADTPKAWGDAVTPDWSITDSTFKSFIQKINNLPKKQNDE